MNSLENTQSQLLLSTQKLNHQNLSNPQKNPFFRNSETHQKIETFCVGSQENVTPKNKKGEKALTIAFSQEKVKGRTVWWCGWEFLLMSIPKEQPCLDIKNMGGEWWWEIWWGVASDSGVFCRSRGSRRDQIARVWWGVAVGDMG